MLCVSQQCFSPAPVEHSGFTQQIATQTEEKLIFPCIAFALYALDFTRNVIFLFCVELKDSKVKEQIICSAMCMLVKSAERWV